MIELVGRRALLLSAALLPIAASQATGFDPAQAPGKLPKEVVPIAYRVNLQPDLAASTLEGSESIRLEFRAGTDRIVINTLGETLRNVRLDGRPVRDWQTDEKQQTTTIRLAAKVMPGVHTLSLSYKTSIGTEPAGIYLQHYSASDGKPTTMLSTQFEPADARRMLPCWDEPAFRARFELTVRVPADWEAIGNMPVRERKVQGRMATVRFEPTPPMPSYLLELSAGDYAALHGSANGVALGIWAPRGRENDGRTALANATTILGDYDEYFGAHYPLPKLDSIAIPGGFSGAMENWGAITYAAQTLLVAPSATLENRQIVFTVQAHEMAHQWFGDLVTMAWWNDLWLNESFASWMAAKETDQRHPEWRWWEDQDGDKEAAMRADSFEGSHPIATTVTDELQAVAAFDPVITYSKGQAVLRMLENDLGASTFRDGMRLYMRAHAVSNATAADLWKAFAEASHADVEAMAGGWITQPGFPLLHVAASCDAGGTRTVRVRQSRFLMQGEAPAELLWDVPLRVRTSADGSAQALHLRNREESFVAGRCGQILSLNADGIGYFRVAYDTDALQANTREFERLPPGDRIALLDDGWALVESGAAPLDRFLNLAEAMHGDQDPRAWTIVSAALAAIERDERNTPGHAAFVTYARSLLAPITTDVGWDPKPGEAPDVRNLRRQLLIELGLWGDPQVIAEARRRFAAFKSDPQALDPELQSIVLPIVAHQADKPTFDALHAIAKGAHDQTTRERLYTSLMWVEDPALARTAAEIAVSEIPPESAMMRLGMVGTLLESHPQIAWQTFSTHVDDLLGVFGPDAPIILVNIGPTRFWRALPPDELEAWLRQHVPAQFAPAVGGKMQTARFNVAEKERLVSAADSYLAARPGTASR